MHKPFNDNPAANADRIVLLSMGLGRDSMAMLCQLLDGELLVEGRRCGPADIDAVVFSDPGAEWDFTYDLIPVVRALCEAHGLRFLVLAKPPREAWEARVAQGKGVKGAPAWTKELADASVEAKAAGGYYHLRAPIMADYMRTGRITVRASAGCTDNHKIRVINGRLLDDLSRERFGLGNRSWGAQVRKGERRPHVVLIGYAADETSRLSSEDAKAQARSFLTPRYPLIEAGITKADEAAILKRHGLNHVRKSGCMMCHYQPDAWFWALRETRPQVFAQVVAYERHAASTNPKMRIRHKTRFINEVVELWRARHPDATVDAVLNKGYDRECERPAAKTPALLTIEEPRQAPVQLSLFA